MSVVTAPRVLYIGGMGRSGSTLLEMLLARAGDLTALGEVVHLWERGLRADERCSCGQSFRHCPLWTAIGARAFDGWAGLDVDRLVDLKNRVDRTRRIPMLARGMLAGPVAEYASYYRKLYAAAADVTGRPVVVDSSKHPSLALVLAHDRQIDLRVVHLVRDPRGVAYSWAKSVVRPETTDQRLMVRHTPAHSSQQWVLQNGLFHLLPRRVPLIRMRYEDLIADAPAALETIRAFAGLPPVVPDAAAAPAPVHSVAGNPMRFQPGPIVLRRDDAWQRTMPAADRRLVTGLTAPLALRYGYLRYGYLRDRYLNGGGGSR